MCNGIEKIKCTVMKCHTNVNSTPFTQLPHKFSYIVAILGHNHFESPNTCDYKKQMKHNETQFQNLLKLLNWPLLNITQLLIIVIY
jgi:hypothetical protein